MRRYNVLYGDAARISRTLSFDELLAMLAADIRHVVAEFARNRTFIHSGAVAWRGCGILIPGRSFSGKTSLVAALVRAGATYYSDEYAVLDDRGRLHPFLKPLSLREPGSAEQTDVPVESLGGRAGVKPVPVGCVVATEYKAGIRWRPRRLSEGQSALALMANAVAARRNPVSVFSTVNRVARDAMAIGGRRGEADQVAAALLEMVERG